MGWDVVSASVNTSSSAGLLLRVVQSRAGRGGRLQRINGRAPGTVRVRFWPSAPTPPGQQRLPTLGPQVPQRWGPVLSFPAPARGVPGTQRVPGKRLLMAVIHHQMPRGLDMGSWGGRRGALDPSSPALGQPSAPRPRGPARSGRALPALTPNLSAGSPPAPGEFEPGEPLATPAAGLRAGSSLPQTPPRPLPAPPRLPILCRPGPHPQASSLAPPPPLSPFPSPPPAVPARGGGRRSHVCGRAGKRGHAWPGHHSRRGGPSVRPAGSPSAGSPR